MIQFYFLALFLSLTDNEFLPGVDALTAFTLVNKCPYTIWPAISNSGIKKIPITGFVLQEGFSEYFQAPSSWNGGIWARTHCSENSTGKFSCLTGDCGSGKIECDGFTSGYPVTLVEFSIDGNGLGDFYDVSLVNGYNLPLLVTPQVRSGANCTTAGCVADINGLCPLTLSVSAEGWDDIACKSACNAFKQDQYCCTGAYSSPSTCKPTNYSGFFKKWCPQAYSYAYDDKTSSFSCSNANYTITFCPYSPSIKSSPINMCSSKSSPVGDSNNNGINNNTNPWKNSTIVYQGITGFNATGAASTCMDVLRPPTVAGAVAVVIALWRLYHTHETHLDIDFMCR